VFGKDIPYYSFIEPDLDIDKVVISTRLFGLSARELNEKCNIEYTPQPPVPGMERQAFAMTKSDWLKQHVALVGSRNPDEIPYLQRRNFIYRARSESGAHYDSWLSEAHEILRDPFVAFGGSIQMTLSTGEEINQRSNPDRFVYVNTPADACIRSIANELLATFRPYYYSSSSTLTHPSSTPK
jgi:hypothetical protein